MRALRAWVVRLRGALAPARRDREFDAELESHLQLHIDDNIRAGMTPVEARRQALIKLGGIEPARQIQRERRGIPLLELLLQDLRGGIRALRSGTSWTAIAMLALAIGLTTAMFSVVDALMLRPVPFKDADRLAWICLFDEHGGPGYVRRGVLDAWRDHDAFEAAEGAWTGTSVLDAGTGPLSRVSAVVTPGLFDMLGVRPIRGRLLAPGDQGALISADLWRSSLGADSSIVGRRVQLDGGTVVVAGVMPDGFRFPEATTEI